MRNFGQWINESSLDERKAKFINDLISIVTKRVPSLEGKALSCNSVRQLVNNEFRDDLKGPVLYVTFGSRYTRHPKQVFYVFLDTEKMSWSISNVPDPASTDALSLLMRDMNSIVHDLAKKHFPAELYGKKYDI